jgi:HAD superfamily hydrolase (TIGR01490 family)
MNLALFDFDGTITSEDTFTGFVHYAVEPTRIRRGKLLLAPLVVGYKLGVVAGTTIRPCVAWLGFRGTREQAVRAAGAAYARDVIPGIIRPHARERIAWHKAQGDTVVVVSASLDVYLGAWCREAGLSLISTELESRGGVFTGRYRGGDCTGPEKRRRVLERYRLSDYGAVYAYGDTREDDELLQIAEKRFYRWQEI